MVDVIITHFILSGSMYGSISIILYLFYYSWSGICYLVFGPIVIYLVFRYCDFEFGSKKIGESCRAEGIRYNDNVKDFKKGLPFIMHDSPIDSNPARVAYYVKWQSKWFIPKSRKFPRMFRYKKSWDILRIDWYPLHRFVLITSLLTLVPVLRYI